MACRWLRGDGFDRPRARRVCFRTTCFSSCSALRCHSWVNGRSSGSSGQFRRCFSGELRAAGIAMINAIGNLRGIQSGRPRSDGCAARARTTRPDCFCLPASLSSRRDSSPRCASPLSGRPQPFPSDAGPQSLAITRHGRLWLHPVAQPFRAARSPALGAARRPALQAGSVGKSQP